jgi:hypothetical protein
MDSGWYHVKIKVPDFHSAKLRGFSLTCRYIYYPDMCRYALWGILKSCHTIMNKKLFKMHLLYSQTGNTDGYLIKGKIFLERIVL